MRAQTIEQPYFDFSRPSSTKVVREYRAKYEAMGEILAEHPQVTALAHRDFCKYLTTSVGGRSGQYTSEQILRALVVMFVEGDSFRGAVIRIDNSEFLQRFVGLGIRPTMDFSFLSKAHSALSEETWQAMNAALAESAREEEKIGGEKLRLDSTVYEANIHYPTDSSLLWDSFPMATRKSQPLYTSSVFTTLEERQRVVSVNRQSLDEVYLDTYHTRHDLDIRPNDPSRYLQLLSYLPSYSLDPACWRDKKSMLAGRIRQIEQEIESREKLKESQIYRILAQEIRVDEELFKLDSWSHEALETNKVLVSRKLTLERMLQDLQGQKWREYTSCFQDISGLKKEIRDVLQEYWNEKRKEYLMGDLH